MDKLQKAGQAEWAAAQLAAIIRNEALKLPNKGYQEFGNKNGGGAAMSSDVFFTTSVLGMTAISHVIEEQAATMSQPASFYASFQKFSRVKPQEARYRQMLASSIPVYIFGVPDVPLWQDPYLKPIALTKPAKAEQPSLTNNWFVVLHNPQFVSMALVTRELPNIERPLHAPDKLLYRNFEGFWTYNKEVINQIVAILDTFIKDWNV